MFFRVRTGAVLRRGVTVDKATDRKGRRSTAAAKWNGLAVNRQYFSRGVDQLRGRRGLFAGIDCDKAWWNWSGAGDVFVVLKPQGVWARGFHGSLGPFKPSRVGSTPRLPSGISLPPNACGLSGEVMRYHRGPYSGDLLPPRTSAGMTGLCANEFMGFSRLFDFASERGLLFD